MDIPVLSVTAVALEKILELRSNESDADALGLRIEVTGTRGVDYTYDLAFQIIAEAADTALMNAAGALTVVVPAADAEKMQGSELDTPSAHGPRGLGRPTLARRPGPRGVV